MLISRPRGTSDLLPGDTARWQRVEAVIRDLCRVYGYGEIRTPLFESTELFQRGVGDITDIVEKEMYTFTDKGGRSLTLRPEGTAPVTRAYLENGLHAVPQPVKLFYVGPMFRHDRPQAGRYRQFHQFGVEIFGAADPAADAEVIALAMHFFDRLGLAGLELHLNSVGCPGCRAVLRKKLADYFEPRAGELCANCRSRLGRNPLRLLDCKEERCREAGRGAPVPVDYLCPECSGHFGRVQRYLDLLGISFKLNPCLVRGLDYYTRTAFEILVPGGGAQDAVGGGGRYDGLVSAIGGPAVPGVGFALGLERTLLLWSRQAGEEVLPQGPVVFIATAGETEETATVLLSGLRAAGVPADREYTGRSLKAQMKFAAKLGARWVIIVGKDELEAGEVVLRDMGAGLQTRVSLGEVVERLRRDAGG
ncbi:MAG: histidine--tRNA ligase [Bacillota bacterium]